MQVLQTVFSRSLQQRSMRPVTFEVYVHGLMCSDNRWSPLYGFLSYVASLALYQPLLISPFSSGDQLT